MSDARCELIVAAMVTALNTGTPAGVPTTERELIDALPDDMAGALALYPVDDQAADVVSKTSPIRLRTMKVVLDGWARATATAPASKVASTYRAWAVSVLERVDPATNPLGSAGLVNYIRELGTTMEWAESDLVFRFQMTFEIEYQQKTGDMTAVA